MSKETFYFSHDYNARDDRKLVNVIMKHGMTGIGIYWCLVEMLYEEGGYLPLEYERITFVLRTEADVIRSIINGFDLFKNDNKNFWSEAVLERLQTRCEKSEKARKSINERWDRIRNDTNVEQPYTKRTTIKERKGEEKRGKKIPKKENSPSENTDKDKILIKNIEIQPEYFEIFLTWLHYKRSKQQTYKNEESTIQAYKRLLKISNNDPKQAIKAIEFSMANNYNGFFRETNGEQKSTNRSGERLPASDYTDGEEFKTD